VKKRALGAQGICTGLEETRFGYSKGTSSAHALSNVSEKLQVQKSLDRNWVIGHFAGGQKAWQLEEREEFRAAAIGPGTNGGTSEKR